MANTLVNISALDVQTRTSDAELYAAFVWELVAQAIMYLLSCVAVVCASAPNIHTVLSY